MPLVVIVEDGTGKADANSYGSRADADAYFEARLHASDWQRADESTRDAALVQASRLIDRSFVWRGTKAVTGSAFEWPRVGVPTPNGEAEEPSTAVPVRVREEAFEVALALIRSDRIHEAERVGEVSTSGRVGSRSFGAAGLRRAVIPATTAHALEPYTLQGVSRLTRAA